MKKKGGNNFELKVGKVTLQLTNQQKVYWPEEGYTKGMLLEYYDSIAEYMLPYLKNRPQSLHRFPNGIKGQSFYQKNVDKSKIPSWLKTAHIYSASNNEYIDYLLCNDKATLLYMANLGCIEINPWNSKVGKPDHPDWAVIDLDPEDISFKEVVKAAHAVNETLEEMDIKCFVKTSGATGMHIYIPLDGKYDYKNVRAFARLVAEEAHSKLPGTTSLERNPAKRKKKVYLDYLQNSKGQTLAAPYSVRPRPGATVSAPLKWEEVNAKLDPTQFTIKNMLKRIEKSGDLWKPVIEKGENISKILKQLSEPVS